MIYEVTYMVGHERHKRSVRAESENEAREQIMRLTYRLAEIESVKKARKQ